MLRDIPPDSAARFAKGRQRRWIVQRLGVIQDLMSGAAKCNAHRCAACGLCSHLLAWIAKQ
jgi:hypothetical protein